MTARFTLAVPDRPVGFLRDLLAQRVARVPTGGSIDWVTYYFRDRRLAAALVEARERGVDVRVTLDGHPRTPHANDAVIEMLEAGLGDGLRVVRGRLDGTPLGKVARPRLHEKLYCFSDPSPVAFVGSFNPSSDSPEAEPEVVEVIGDHDRAHNVLVELRDPSSRPGSDGSRAEPTHRAARLFRSLRREREPRPAAQRLFDLFLAARSTPSHHGIAARSGARFSDSHRGFPHQRILFAEGILHSRGARREDRDRDGVDAPSRAGRSRTEADPSGNFGSSPDR